MNPFVIIAGIAAVIAAVGGAKRDNVAIEKNNATIDKNNEFLEEAYLYERKMREPIVQGVNGILENYNRSIAQEGRTSLADLPDTASEALSDPEEAQVKDDYPPYTVEYRANGGVAYREEGGLLGEQEADPRMLNAVRGAQTLGEDTLTVGQDIVDSTGTYLDTGKEGAESLSEINKNVSPENTLAIADKFIDPNAEAVTEANIREANKRSDLEAKNASVNSFRGGTALSGQAARIQGAVEGQRQQAVGDIASKAKSDAYKYGIDQSRLEQQNANAAALGALGTGAIGSSLAQAGLGLGSAGSNLVIDQPYRTYADAVAAYNGQFPQAPTFGSGFNPTKSPLGAGAGIFGQLVGGLT